MNTQIALLAGTYQPDRCGVAHYAAHLRQTLQQQGISSIVLTTTAAAEAVQDETVCGVVPDWRLRDLRRLVRQIQQTPCDLLHIQHAAGTYGFQRSVFLLPALLRLANWRKPIVTTIHEYGWWEWQPRGIPPQWLEWLKVWGQQQGWWDREDGFLLTQSQAIITTNHQAQTLIQTRLPHLTPSVHYLPIAPNIPAQSSDRIAARQQLRQHYGWPSEAAIVVFFGFLHPVKGLEILLNSFQQVAVTCPQARLLLMGGVESLALPKEAADRYWQQLQERITTLGLETIVQMTGYLEAERVSNYLNGADIGVLPFNHGVTLKSGSLLALLEHQLPTIATRADPPDPALESEPLIHWVFPRQEAELTTTLLAVLNQYRNQYRPDQSPNPPPRSNRTQWNWEAIGQSHVNIYQTLLSDLVIRPC